MPSAIQPDAAGWNEARAALANVAKAFPDVARRGAQAAMLQFSGKWTSDRLGGPKSASSLAVRSGALRRSVRVDSSIVPPAAWMAVGKGAPYAASHEAKPLGKAPLTILPKKRFLAIPWVSLTTGKMYEFKSPREEPDLRFVPTRGGATGLLVRDILLTGRGKKGGRKVKPGEGVKSSKVREASEIVWLLVPRVRIPARMNLWADFTKFGPTAYNVVKVTIARWMAGLVTGKG